jgi:glycine cleavage system H protein
MNIPEELCYTDHDEWVRIEGDEIVTGITDYAQDQLSDIVYVELPEVGDHFERGEAYGVVESVKAASDVYSPLNGTVAEVNSAVEDSPELVNQDPYGEGWLFKLKDVSGLDELLDADAYAATIEE